MTATSGMMGTKMEDRQAASTQIDMADSLGSTISIRRLTIIEMLAVCRCILSSVRSIVFNSDFTHHHHHFQINDLIIAIIRGQTVGEVCAHLSIDS